VTATKKPTGAAPARLALAPGPGRPLGGFVALLALVAVLSIVGLVMVLSASSVHDLRTYHSPWYSFARQLVYLAVGAAVMAVVLRIDYHRWRRWAPVLLGACGLCLVAVLLPGIGNRVNGSRRWLGLGPVQFQPSELAKLALALFCADILCRRAGTIGTGVRAAAPVLAAFAAAAFLVMVQPDMGTTLVLGVVVMANLFVGGVRLPAMGAMVGAVGAVALLSGVVAPYRRDRLLSFMHPLADSGNKGYQSVQGLVALGSGRLTGVGLGASRAKWGFLPNAHTDFIFAIVGDELGLVGTFLVLGLFMAFAVLGVRAALRAPDRFGALVAAGVTAWVVGQAVVNMGAVVGLLPVTGVPLPFVSYGGSALVITMAATGILLNIAAQGRPPAGAGPSAPSGRSRGTPPQMVDAVVFGERRLPGRRQPGRRGPG